MKQLSIPLPKKAYKIITTYRNNRDKEYAYIKYFSLESSASSYCLYREDNPKVLTCDFQLYRKPTDVIKESNGNVLRPIKGKLNYYKDKEGYKYYIKDGIKIKSNQTV